MRILRRALFLSLLVCVIGVSGQEDFSGVSYGYVPEGKPCQQSDPLTLQQCAAACAANSHCKAYAFRTSKPVCYFYSEVFMGGTRDTREMLYSAGLSIIPMEGFTAAFKRSSFPKPPVFSK